MFEHPGPPSIDSICWCATVFEGKVGGKQLIMCEREVKKRMVLKDTYLVKFKKI